MSSFNTQARGALFTILATLAAAGASESLAMTRIGGAPIEDRPVVRVYDSSRPASPKLTGRTGDLLQSGCFAIVHDRLYVAVGSQVVVYGTHELGETPRSLWSAGSRILALADGQERGLLLVLDRTSLRLVRFPDEGSPSVLWSAPVDETALSADPGRLMVRDGDSVFVADASVPGIRLLSIDPHSPPRTQAIYQSPEGMVHDVTLWNRTLSLLAESALVVLDAGDPMEPTFRRLGSYRTSGRPSCADANSAHAFVADGVNLLVLDIDPSSPIFLAAPLDTWTAPAPIRSVRLDKDDRAYVLIPGAYEILDVAPFGGK